MLCQEGYIDRWIAALEWLLLHQGSGIGVSFRSARATGCGKAIAASRGFE